MQIKPSDLLDVVHACLDVENTYHRGGSGFVFSEETRRKSYVAVIETYNLYLMQIVEHREKMKGKNNES